MNIDIQIVRKHLKGAAVGSDIQLFGTVASTNSVMRDLAARGAPEGTVVIADEQTAGHGRFGKPWFSPPRVNLYASVLFRPVIQPSEAPGFSFVGPLAVADTIKAEGLDATIKFAAALLNHLAAWVATYRERDVEALLAAWRDRDILTGRRVEVRGEGPSYEGRVLGVDAQGYLLIRDSLGKRRRVLAGEIRKAD